MWCTRFLVLIGFATGLSVAALTQTLDIHLECENNVPCPEALLKISRDDIQFTTDFADKSDIAIILLADPLHKKIEEIRRDHAGKRFAILVNGEVADIYDVDTHLLKSSLSYQRSARLKERAPWIIKPIFDRKLILQAYIDKAKSSVTLFLLMIPLAAVAIFFLRRRRRKSPPQH